MSSSPYNPDPDAVPSDFDYIRLLSQRDLSSAIPVNFVTVPGISLTSACFPFNRYDTASATKCVSNLLAAGFRRLEVDLFWDVSRTTWSFCPVQLGEVEPQLSVKQESTTSQTPSTSATLAQDEMDGRREVRATPTVDGGQEPSSAKLWPRQTTTGGILSQSIRPTMSASSIPSGTTTRTAAFSPENSSTAVSDAPNPEGSAAPDDQTLLQVGNYVCSTQLDFHLFLEVLYGHFTNTEDNLNATTAYITLNIYPAASVSSVDGSDAVPSQDNLPQGNNLLSSLITANNSQYLYTPQLLSEQRADLDEPGSWFTVRQPLLPDYMFYEVNENNNILSTPDGWPSESVVELARAKRMLAGFGNIDSRMQGYNFALDESTIFPPGYLQDSQNVDFATNGTITSGCIFNAHAASLSQANSSWATHHISNDSSAADPTTLRVRLAQASNLTDCGISPILNTTLLNASADTKPTPYKSYVMSTIWSWAADQPRNFGTSDENDDDDQNNGLANRCAVLNATSTRWQAHSCDTSHHVTCRANNGNPFDFRIADASTAYDKAENACRGDVQFAVPRTALENSFLVSKWQAYRSERDITDELLWVDFNDLDIEDCWVIGQNSTCPYQDQKAGQGRKVAVPIVAAVVVFVLAILTVFIKCAANRRNTRRRRKRVDDGWDYEGVPS